jgi:hypothetical protein
LLWVNWPMVSLNAWIEMITKIWKSGGINFCHTTKLALNSVQEVHLIQMETLLHLTLVLFRVMLTVFWN